MEDPNSIPFEFEDCDAFLASLDDNNPSKQQQLQFQQQPPPNCYPPMHDYSSTAAASGNPQEMWTMNQQIPVQQTYVINQPSLEPSNFMVQPNSFYNGSGESLTSSPLSSPSMSIHSISDSDTTGDYLTGSLVYPQNQLTATNLQPAQPMTFNNAINGSNSTANTVTNNAITNTSNLDPSYSVLSSYHQVNSPYHSAGTDSSSGEPGTSPEDEYTYNDTGFQAASNQDASVKQEPSSPIDRSDKKGRQSKKLSSHKLLNEGKSSKVTKPKKEKTSHNMIEKRYRTNINDKILALRDCVPSLRCVVTGGPRPAEDLEGLTPASKLNKATVLTKATEYIMHLQKRNSLLVKELTETRHAQGRPMDMQLMMDLGGVPPGMPAYPQGHPGMPQQNNGYASKAMMMSMAGIMGAGLMSDGSDMQGLSSIPLFSFLSSASLGPINVKTLLVAFKFLLVAGTILFLIVPSLFDSASQKKTLDYSMNDDLNEYSLREMRKQTWLTNIRSFDIPSETFTSQLLAFFKNLVQALIINLVGMEGYEMVSSVFEKDQLNVKRVALARAIDAQLSGGDEGSASRGRLFYTFAKSFILPPTPSRYLTQSIHINVLCNDIYLLDSVGAYFSRYLWNKARSGAQEIPEDSEDDEVAIPKSIRSLLDSQNEPSESLEICQRLYNIAYGLPLSDGCLAGEDDEGYLSVVTDKSLRSIIDIYAALLANSLLHGVLVGVLERDKVDFSTLEFCSKFAPSRSIVARRVAIAEALLLGPKNALYAKNAMDLLKEELDQQDWISHELSTGISSSIGNPSRIVNHDTHPGSIHSGQAILEDEDEDDLTVSSSSSSIMSDESDSESITTERGEDVTFLTSAVKTTTTPFVVSQDSRLGIRCSLIACYLSRGITAPAFTLLQNVEINTLENIGLLGFVAMWKVLSEMHKQKSSVNRRKLEDLSAVARVWLGGNTGTQEGLSLNRLRELVGESVQMSKFFGGFECELDEGYGTQ